MTLIKRFPISVVSVHQRFYFFLDPRSSAKIRGKILHLLRSSVFKGVAFPITAMTRDFGDLGDSYSFFPINNPSIESR